MAHIRHTAFTSFSVAARQGQLPEALQPFQAEIASAAFEQFARLEGLQAAAALLAGTQFMLAHCAPDVSFVPECRANLAEGVVLLHYADVCNPFPVFQLPVGSDALKSVQASWDASLASRRYRAAQRYKFWNARLASFTDQPLVRSALARHEQAHPMPSKRDYPRSPDLEAAVANWVAERQQLRHALRVRRIQRVLKVEQATRSPAQLSDWHSLLTAAMREVMLPCFRAEQALITN